MATTSAQVQQLYVAYLGRAADKAGLDYWLNELNADNATLTLENLRANFVNEQQEYADVYGGLTREETVVKIYNNLFGRAPDAAGLTYWTTGAGATVNADQLLTAFVNGAGATDAKTVANKVLVAEVYTSTAGANFSAADAAQIIANVTANNATIGTALDSLEDGTLSGIAIPTGVSALKADAIAEKAVVDSATAKAADLLALDKELVKLSVTDDKADLLGDVKLSTATGYDALSTAVKDAIDTARGTLDTDALTTAVATDTTAEKKANTNYITDQTQTNASTKIAAYKAAVIADQNNVAPTLDAQTEAKATLSAYTANTANTAAYTDALKAAGLDSTTTVDQLYTTLSAEATTAANVNKITAAFSSIDAFSVLDKVAAQAKAAAKADTDLAKAVTDLDTGTGLTWKGAYDTLIKDQADLAASKSVDAVETKYEAIINAHNALVTAAEDAGKAVDANSALTVAADDVGVEANAEVFYFGGTAHKAVQTDDFSINFGAKDALYVGEGYSLNTAGTIDAATGHIVGGNNNALEVFFFKDATNGEVKAVIETTKFGSDTADLSTAGANATTDNVAVITLSGVTDVAQVSFANGVISHVA